MTIDINHDNNHALLPLNHNHPGDEDPRKEEEDLLPLRQEQALEMMMKGISDGDIAQKLGVTRQTVNNWRNHDDQFRFELKRRHMQTWESRRNEMPDLYQEAIAVVRRELKSKNAKTRFKAAVQILKMPALQDSLKNKGPQDLNRLEEDNALSILKAALKNVTKELDLERTDSKYRNKNNRMVFDSKQPGHTEEQGIRKVEDRPCY